MTYQFTSEKVLSVEGEYEPFVYIIKNTQNGKKYIGSRTAKNCLLKDIGKRYFTSSEHIKNVWKDDPDLYVVEDIHLCQSNHDALNLEAELIRSFDAVYDDNFINMGHPRAGFNRSGIPLSDKCRKILSDLHKGSTRSNETKKKISDSRLGRFCGEDNPNYGKSHTKETKARISELATGRTHTEESKKKISESVCGEKNGFYGKKHSKESKKKISESFKYRPKILCLHCDREFLPHHFSMWHGDKCKMRGTQNEGDS